MAPRRVPLQLLAGILLAGGVAAIPPARHALGTGLYLLATGQLAQFQRHLLSLGVWAPAVSIALMVAESVAIPVPVTIIMVANGLVFGVWRGTLVSLAGGLLGGLVAYVIGRYPGRALVERLVPAGGLQAADRLMAKHGRWALVVGHWIPGIPGDPMSYAAGITGIALVPFLLLTTAGLVPGIVVTAYLGEQAAGDVPLKYWLAGIAVVIGAVVAFRAIRRRRT